MKTRNSETTIPVLQFVTPLFHPFVNPRVGVYLSDVMIRQIAWIYNIFSHNGGQIPTVYLLYL